jgi:hypothetical protein
MAHAERHLGCARSSVRWLGRQPVSHSWVVTLTLGHGSTVATIGDPTFADLQDPNTGGRFPVELTAPGLHVAGSVFVFTFSGLPEFFQEMADEWRGWAEPKLWASPNHDLSISAQSTHQGHTRLTLTVRDGAYSTWSASLEVEIEAGEETSAISRLLAASWPTPQS